VKGVKRFHKL